VSGYPDNNPKTAIGAKKVPLHLVPPSAKHHLALALSDGAKKYGPYNWREHQISVSVYYDAAQRHWDAFWDGEDLAADSGIHHVAHAMACCALVLDALTLGKLNDDRPSQGAAPKLQQLYAERVPIPYGELIPHNRAAEILRAIGERDDDAPGYSPTTPAGAQSGATIHDLGADAE
jgi:hypothetical protein